MKARILLIITAILVCMSANAKNFVLKSGNTSCFQEKAIAVVKMDYTNARFQHEKTLQEESGENWAVRDSMMHANFVIGFNNFTSKKGGMTASLSADNAKYEIIYHIENIDRRQGGAALVWGQLVLVLKGTVEVIEIATGNVVCAIQTDYTSSKASFKPTERIRSAFEELGWQIAKFKK